MVPVHSFPSHSPHPRHFQKGQGSLAGPEGPSPPHFLGALPLCSRVSLLWSPVASEALTAMGEQVWRGRGGLPPCSSLQLSALGLTATQLAPDGPCSSQGLCLRAQMPLFWESCLVKCFINATSRQHPPPPPPSYLTTTAPHRHTHIHTPQLASPSIHSSAQRLASIVHMHYAWDPQRLPSLSFLRGRAGW